MKYKQLSEKISTLGMGLFSIKDLRKIYSEEEYLNISISRLLQNGELVQIARGVYSLPRESINIEKIATQLYYPSYISFESALAKYGIINQGPMGLTLATTRHSRKSLYAGIECKYSQLKPELYFGFELLDGVYIASAEKALLDELYLICFGKRKVDVSEWTLDGLDHQKIYELAEPFGKSVKNMLKEMGLSIS